MTPGRSTFHNKPTSEELDLLETSFSYPRVAASTEMVKRTHRVVRAQARSLEARKKKTRSLWIPLSVSAGLLFVITCAIWSVLDQYEAAPTGLPDASQQMLVLLMWCLPVTITLLAVVWFRRNPFAGERPGSENA